jgi:hypothetical protein
MRIAGVPNLVEGRRSQRGRRDNSANGQRTSRSQASLKISYKVSALPSPSDAPFGLHHPSCDQVALAISTMASQIYQEPIADKALSISREHGPCSPIALAAFVAGLYLREPKFPRHGSRRCALDRAFRASGCSHDPDEYALARRCAQSCAAIYYAAVVCRRVSQKRDLSLLSVGRLTEGTDRVCYEEFG